MNRKEFTHIKFPHKTFISYIYKFASIVFPFLVVLSVLLLIGILLFFNIENKDLKANPHIQIVEKIIKVQVPMRMPIKSIQEKKPIKKIQTKKISKKEVYKLKEKFIEPKIHIDYCFRNGINIKPCPYRSQAEAEAFIKGYNHTSKKLKAKSFKR